MEFVGKVTWTVKGRDDGIEEMVTRTHESQPFPDGRHLTPGIASDMSHSPRGEHLHSHFQSKMLRNKDIRHETEAVSSGWGLAQLFTLLHSCQSISSLCSQQLSGA